MLDIGGWEFLLIVVLGIIIVGPKDLPGAVRAVSAFVRKARDMAREFQWGMEEMAREAELDQVAKQIAGDAETPSLSGGLQETLEKTIDPEGEIRNAMRADPDPADGGESGPPEDAAAEALEGDARPVGEDGGERREGDGSAA